MNKNSSGIAILLISISIAGNLFAQSRRAPAAKPASTSKPGSTASTANLPSEQTVNEFMHRMFGYDPSIKWKITQIKPSYIPNMAEVMVTVNDQQSWTLYVSPDGKYAFPGDPIPFGTDPFGPVREELKTRAKGPAKGPADAPVTLVEFSDLQCPHCKQAQPTLERLLTDVPNARLVFESWPIENIHKWSGLAARYADCIQRANGNDAFFKFVDGVFNQQEEISNLTDQNYAPKLNEIAQSAGADPTATATCADSATAKADVIQSQELGASLGVNSTPTVFLNGRKINNINAVPYEQLKSMVQFEAQPTTH